jgi:hypothetical protein
MQIQSTEDRIETFLEKKFRYSKSFSTKRTYGMALKKFEEFLRIKHKLDLNQAITQFEAKR